MIIRILSAILLFFCVIFLPFWLSIVLAAVAMFYFSFFFEAVFILLVSDLLYGAHETRFAGTVFASFILSLVLLIIIELAKKRMRIYSKNKQ